MDITPDKQNVDLVFSSTPYYIDFYQRDYRWTEEPVKRLLDDVFYKFREQYERSKDLDPGKETITARYPWYYLNTYVTNIVDGRVYVVDGQQRLTTLSLILMKLHHLAKKFGSKLSGWIEKKIAGQSGYEHEFWMSHFGQRSTQQALFDGQDPNTIDLSSGITAQNMVRNYTTISAYLEKELRGLHQFDTFVFYFLYRGGIHDQDNYYAWGMTDPPYTINGAMVTEFLATLNRAPCFAGHCDWRIPNIKELQSIANYQNAGPAVDAAFSTSCAAGCTVDGASGTTMCSCTQSGGYWSSTTCQDSPDYAWGVGFGGGSVGYYKGDGYVRAVQGGS